MPIYTYECLSCSGTLEKRQGFSEDPLTIHETCGGSLKRVIHPVGIVFKGSGFYNTDYKNSTGSTASNDTEPAKPAASSSDASSSTNGSSSAESSSSSGSSGGDSSSSSAASSSSSSAPAATPASTTP